MEPSMLANLRNIGLTDKAATVYAAVLEAGVAYPSKISEKTKLNRSTVYKILADLRLKGLVTEIERGKKLCYQIEDPSRLEGFAKRQIATAEEQYENAKKIVPDLKGLLALTPNKPRVRFFEGMEGIIAIYEEHVSATEPYEMLSYSNVDDLIKTLPKKFVADYIKQKEKVGITTRAIFPQTEFAKKYNKEIYSGTPADIHVKDRFISPEQFPFKADITIFGKNKVSIINFQDNAMIGVVIEDATITGMMRMIFELAWKGTKTE